MSNIFRENLIKNILIVFVLTVTYPLIQGSLVSANIAADKAAVGSLLVAVSILAVTACFGNFAFTYEDVRKRKFVSRVLAHATTGMLMLLIGLSLEMTSVLAGLLVGKFFIFDLSLLILYLSSVLYDFWDLARTKS